MTCSDDFSSGTRSRWRTRRTGQPSMSFNGCKCSIRIDAAEDSRFVTADPVHASHRMRLPAAPGLAREQFAAQVRTATQVLAVSGKAAQMVAHPIRQARRTE